MAIEDIAIDLDIDKKDTHCVLTRRAGSSQTTCLVIGHGASGDLSSGNLPQIAQSLAEAGVAVLRYNAAGQLPARVKRLEGILGSKDAHLKGFERWILAGHSMGGRTACAVARNREDVVAVILFSYPLHPPGKPNQLRDEDLTALHIPVLFVKGTKDPFSTEEPWQAVLSRMASSKVDVELIDKGDHSLNSKTGAGKKRYEEWISRVIEFAQMHTSSSSSSKEESKRSPEELKEGKKRKRQRQK